MKNKLLLTSALAGVVAFSGAASAELKLSVNHETTIAASSVDGGGANSANAIGTETNLKATGTTALTNGLNVGFNLNYEMDGSDAREFQLIVGNDLVDFIVGNDLTQGINSSAVPKIGEHIGTIAARGIATVYQDSFYAANENNQDDHVAIQIKNVAGGNIVALYAPGSQLQGDDASTMTDIATGSGTTISYLGKPMPGLTVGLSRATKQGANSSTVATNKEDTQKAYSIAYTMGKFSAGVEKRTFDDGAGVKDLNGMYYGVTAVISDNLSVGLNYAVAENDTTTSAPDEKTKMISLGYNLGGLGLELSYAEIENADNSTATTADGEVIQLRTVVSF